MMTINIEKDSIFGYTVEVDGEVILECLGKDELQTLTIGMIMEYAEDAKAP